ncbi:MAG: histidine kinase [Marinilabiliales bacterium]
MVKLYNYDIKNKKFINAKTKYNLNFDRFLSIININDKLLISTSDSSVLFKNNTIIPFSNVTFYKKNDNLLIGMDNENFVVYKIINNKLMPFYKTTYNTPYLENINFNSLNITKDYIYVTTDYGLFETNPSLKIFDNKFFNTNQINIKNTLFAGNKIWFIGDPFGYMSNNKFINLNDKIYNTSLDLSTVDYCYPSNGKIYMISTTNNILEIFDTQRLEFINDNLAKSLFKRDPSIQIIDYQNNTWYFADGNIIIDKGNNKDYYYFDENKEIIKSDSINITAGYKPCFYQCFIDNDDMLWIGTLDGLWSYYDGSFQYFNDTALNKGVVAIAQDENKTIWFSTKYNLISLNKSSNSFIYHNNEFKKLSIEPYSEMFIDNENYLYYSKYKFKIIDDSLKYICEIYSHKYLKDIQNISYYTAAIDSNNNFWMCSPDKIYSVPLSKLEADKSLPEIFIRYIEITGNNHQRIYYPENSDNDILMLEPDEQSIKIYYEAPLLNYDLNNLKFYYNLDNISNWYEQNKPEKIEFSFLPAGEYNLKIRYSDKAESVFSKIRLLKIHRKPYFFETYTFIALLILLIAFIFLTITHFYIKSLRKKEQYNKTVNQKISELKIKALQAQMNPHFIFNTLNSIQYLISEHETDKASDAINLFSKLIRTTLDFINKDFISLSEELTYLNYYVEMEKLRFSNKISFNIKNATNLDAEVILMPPLLLQPIVENAIIHGLRESKNEDGQISLQILNYENNIKIIVFNNGVPYNKENDKINDTKIHGLNIIRNRLNIFKEKYHKEFNIIINNKDTGTEVIITLPKILKYD